MSAATDLPHLVYPAPLPKGEDISVDFGGVVDFETPVLIVGGGPVGMLQALMFARLHDQPCMLIERETTTTIYPKMEYTNGRSMDIYRMMGLHEEIRALADTYISPAAGLNEPIITGLSKAGKLIHIWERDSPEAQREKSHSQNDGSQYLEPHMRCHQILIEAWLKEKVEAEPLIRSHWGTSFVGLVETPSHILTRVRKSDGTTLTIKSQYLIGCDGGGSQVRKSVNLESKRQYLNLSTAFIHFRSSSLRQTLNSLPPFWHLNIIGGCILVSQDSADLFTAHLILPPDEDPSSLSPQEILTRSLHGCAGGGGGDESFEIDSLLCRGTWRADVAIASKFVSGRVLLAGDSAHQLSPVGGHGLNSGIADAHAAAWMLSAKLRGWGGEGLLGAYDAERRGVALQNLGHVRRALEGVILPVFSAQNVHGVEGVCGDGEEGERVRREIKETAERGRWMHDQNGNILGYAYEGATSGIVMEGREVGERPRGTDERVVPTTWPGSQAPRVWMGDGRNTFDAWSARAFNLVDFSPEGTLSRPFVEAAEELGVPLKVLKWHHESHVRKIYERDLVLIRPDSHVAWRAPDDAVQALSRGEASKILKIVTGHST